ncbi:MAG: heavy metal translocating P-type ATPase, partial [Bacteroidetes bacterium]
CFTPSCDAILHSSGTNRIARFIAASAVSHKVIYSSFVIALIYNIVGLFFALRGELSPLFAAVVMPLSSVSIILFTTLASRFLTIRILNR